MGRSKKKADKARAQKGSSSGGKGGKVTKIRQRSATTAAAAAERQGIAAWFSRTQSFLKEVRVEFDKTTWPSRKEIIAMTTAVLALTFFFTAYLGVVDITLSKLVSFLIY